MDFGDTSTLRRAAATLDSGADDTHHTTARAHAAVSGLADAVDHYQRPAVVAFQGSWQRAARLLSSVTDASTAAARHLCALADALDAARVAWAAAFDAAVVADFTVYDDGTLSTVTAPSDATEQQVTHAAHLQARLRDAACDAQDARRTAAWQFESLDPRGLDELGLGNGTITRPVTGNPALDEQIYAQIAPLVGVHHHLHELR